MSTARRLQTLREKLCWDSSVLAPPLAALVFIEATRLPTGRGLTTAAVDGNGRMFYNPAFFGKLNDGELAFVILHECLHMVLRHHLRADGRDRTLWNIAADLVINDAIPALGLSVQRPAEGVFRDVHAPWIPANLCVEEVYEHLRQRADSVPKASGEALAGCGVEPDSSGEGGEGGNLPEGLSPDTWDNIALQVENAAKSASRYGLAAALAPLLKIPPARVPWQALLRRLAATAISRAGRDVVTWSRRSRRSPPGFVFPGTRTNDVRLAIIIDSSGSMSDEELGMCVAETHAAINAAGVSAFLVVHDHTVRTKSWIRPGSATTAIAEKVVGRGGTLFEEAYRTIADERVGFAAVVHFTDGMPGDVWPAVPGNCKKGVCALTPDGHAPSVPRTFELVPIRRPG